MDWWEIRGNRARINLSECSIKIASFPDVPMKDLSSIGTFVKGLVLNTWKLGNLEDANRMPMPVPFLPARRWW